MVLGQSALLAILSKEVLLSFEAKRFDKGTHVGSELHQGWGPGVHFK